MTLVLKLTYAQTDAHLLGTSPYKFIRLFEFGHHFTHSPCEPFLRVQEQFILSFEEHTPTHAYTPTSSSSSSEIVFSLCVCVCVLAL